MTAVIALLLVALGLVAFGTVRLIEGERTTLLERFATEQRYQVAEVAKAFTEDLEDVRDDLLFSARLLRTANLRDDGERELRALLAAVAPYRLANVYDASGRRLLHVIDPRVAGDFDPEAVEVVMRETALAALASRESFRISPAIERPDTEGFRVFATSIPIADHAIVLSLLVDTKPYFKRTHLLLAGTQSALLVLGENGLPLSASDKRIVEALRRDEAGLRPLVKQMSGGANGSLQLDDRIAALLHFEKADVIAAYAPISRAGETSWSLAKLVSTSTLREHERAIITRLGISGLAIALCLVAFATYFVIAWRRALLVRERLRHAEALARLHEKTEKILDNIPAGVIAFSDSLAVTAINRILRDRLDGSAIGGKLDSAFPHASSSALTKVRGLLAEAIASDRVQTLVAEELDLFGRDGQYSIHAVPLQAEPSDARVLLLIEDLTEVASLTNQLLHAEKLATVGILAAGIAHEVGTPLGVIRGRAEFMLEKLGASHREANDLGIILDQSDLVTRTIRELLDFSRAKPTDVRAVSVHTVCRTVQELLRIEVERRSLRFTTDVPVGLPCVAADRDQLQQVLVNLLMNACDACAEGGSLRISAALEASRDLVRIDVIDDGCGIAEENRHRVFDPFFTTKKRGHGTGLGLTLAAQIVRTHGAQIELASEPEIGTRITLWWPTAVVLPTSLEAHDLVA